MLVTLRLLKNFIGSKGIEFNSILQRFYVVNYKNFLVDSNYELAIINKKIIAFMH